ncbi:carbamoyltransferase HypF [Spirulina major CS-329]|uniref:carbamoyltransferase HypF n=3 Tax=Spirulinaceae TaxID=1890448 RepID=UPI00232E88E7|nr:carbamoyltransferase HypF [Spirulina major]MDB9503086.1 carbamoyltransferase HypF [Spirulina major CS-329]
MDRQRQRLTITGVVQGVGFRPCVYRVAQELGLTGWVKNSSQGVEIEIEGDRPRLDQFPIHLTAALPPNAAIHSLEATTLPPQGDPQFEIRHSTTTGPKTTLVLPDLATCSACVADLLDPQNRRYHYPFTNCTHCGPRYTIINALPYDRPNTTMAGFKLCPACQQEYDDPGDRRFHAQPNACPICGPTVALWDRSGHPVAQGSAAIAAVVAKIAEGKIIAVKGLGGFHLLAAAEQASTVAKLRQRKQRPDKPFALMYPVGARLGQDCYVSPQEWALLQSPQAPIVILSRRSEAAIAPNVAPHNPTLGVMLPYTPLHHLILAQYQHPVVATSGNRADEPICIDEQAALERLAGIADLFLVHNRPIVRPVDDSIVRVMAGQVVMVRRSRGYAPLPVAPLPQGMPPTLAVGAHQKNTIALTVNRQIILSQHIGDLSNTEALDAFEQTITSLESLYGTTPERIVCDRHPDYLSSQYATQCNLPLQQVQHHHAHVLAAIAAAQLWDRPVLGVAWDGTGYGEDGTIWGGELLRVDGAGWQRWGHWLPFPLPGGDVAAREPRRSALGLLWALWREACPPCPGFTPSTQALLLQGVRQGVNTPLTSSVGRLFDGVAAMLGLCDRATFEGQGAMLLEFAAHKVETSDRYPWGRLTLDSGAVGFDWRPLIAAMWRDRDAGQGVERMAAKFHNTLIDVIVTSAAELEIRDVVLTGGCFQNRYLVEGAITQLQHRGFRPHIPHQLPPHDGSIAVGQLVAAYLALNGSTTA